MRVVRRQAGRKPFLSCAGLWDIFSDGAQCLSVIEINLLAAERSFFEPRRRAGCSVFRNGQRISTFVVDGPVEGAYPWIKGEKGIVEIAAPGKKRSRLHCLNAPILGVKICRVVEIRGQVECQIGRSRTR